MPLRLRALLLKTPVLVAIGVVVFYFLFGYLLFPPLAKWGAEKYIADKTGHRLVLGEAKFDPLRLSLRVKDLQLSEPGGKPLLGFAELFVDFEAKSLFNWAYTLADIRLTGPRARVELLPDGSLNWNAFLQAFKDDEEEKDKPLPRLLIDRVALEKGSLEFEDRMVAGGFKTRLEPLNFQLTDVSTLPDDKGAYTLSTRNQAGTRMRWRGEMAFNPIKASGELAIDDILLSQVWPYVDSQLAMAPPEGKAAVSLTYQAGYADKHFALLLDKLGMRLEGLALRGEKAEKPAVALDLVEVSGGRFDLDQRRLGIAALKISGGQVTVQRRADGSIDLQDWFKPSADSGPPKAGAAPARGLDALDRIKPGDVIRLDGLSFEHNALRLHKDVLPRLDKVLAALQANTDLRLHVAGHTDSVGSEAYNLKLSNGRANAVRDYLVGRGIAAERVQAKGFGEGRPIADNASEAGRAANRRVVLRFYLPGEARPNEEGDAAQLQPDRAAVPWRVALDRFDLDGLGVRLTDAGFVTPVTLEAGNLRVSLAAAAEIGAGEPQASLDAIGVGVRNVKLVSAGNPAPLITLGGLSLEGGQVDLAKRQAHIDRLLFSSGRTELVRGPQGELPILQALARQPAPAGQQLDRKLFAQEAGPAWKFGADRVDLAGFALAVRDEGVQPALALDLQDIRASATGVSENLQAALPVQLAVRVVQGGGFEARGKVVPGKPTADLRLKLAGLSLKPAQPYLSRAANLKLASGRASSSGRLRFDNAIRYEGGFALDGLLLNEMETGERFLAWKSMSSNTLRVTPNSLDIGSLNVDGLGAKLIIFEDKTVNLKKILTSTPPTADGNTTPVVNEHKSKQAGSDFRVGIDSVKVRDGELDFADLSLALPFGTRIHQLQGTLTGISSQADGAHSQMEFEGRVDDYGLARAKGEVNLFDPTGYMDIKTVFRNVEMTRLTPYSATFAGRKIASGKLSLDLEYKIKARQLQGENQVIMDKLTLGERVESPTAKNLPLDLAIAVLSDSDGRIDLGLPVSGSLDDPKFSYGKIIWKAIVNVITKIVTAPFRALGKLLGGSAEKLENLAFDPGSAQLLPPERETLKNLAQALEKRPQLALAVQGTWNAGADRAAIKESRVRAAVAKAMGVKPAEGEVAPPVSLGSANAQEAIEALYAEGLGKDALKSFKARYYQANPDKQTTMDKLRAQLAGVVKGKEKPLSAEERAAMQGKELHALLHRELIDKEPVPDEVLHGLATQRAQAVADELVVVNKVAKERVQIGKSEAVAGDGKNVAVKLSLEGARQPAAATAAPEQPKPAPTSMQPVR